MNVGHTIREHRIYKGFSQGDIEKRTGLLRCYLSRVENGHTLPSLGTLNKIAIAMDVTVHQLLVEDAEPGKYTPNALTDEELHFLIQMRRYSVHLDDADRVLLVDMVRKFASTGMPN